MNKSHRINNKLSELANSLKKTDQYSNKLLNSIQLSKFNTDRVELNRFKSILNSELINILKTAYNSISNFRGQHIDNSIERVVKKKTDINKDKHVQKEKPINICCLESQKKSDNIVLIQKDDIFKSKYYYSVDNKPIKQFFDKYINLKITNIECIYLGFCLAINPKFYIYDDETKNNFMMSLKKKMAIDLEKENLYRKLGYNKKRIFKRSVFENQLFENDTNIGEIFYKYLGDYFDINFLIIDNGHYIHYNEYNNGRMSIILHKIDNSIFINLNIRGLSLIHPDKIKLDDSKEPLKSNILNKKKLVELQEMAKKYNIEIQKQGKSKVINKTKNELIQAIENLINK